MNDAFCHVLFNRRNISNGFKLTIPKRSGRQNNVAGAKSDGSGGGRKQKRSSMRRTFSDPGQVGLLDLKGLFDLIHVVQLLPWEKLNFHLFLCLLTCVKNLFNHFRFASHVAVCCGLSIDRSP